MLLLSMRLDEKVVGVMFITPSVVSSSVNGGTAFSAPNAAAVGSFAE
jgi:hypothetical protein